MRALSNLINLNQPDLVLFVGEALVGNDAVDQLTKFNQRLADLCPDPAQRHPIDGIVLTKFDTIDDKVRAVLLGAGVGVDEVMSCVPGCLGAVCSPLGSLPDAACLPPARPPLPPPLQVGAALSMVYTSGAPIMFVGCGQTYVDLKKLHVKSVVKSLLK